MPNIKCGIFLPKEKKDDIDPFLSGNEVCPLIGLVKDTGEPLRGYEYVGNQLARIYSIEDNVTTVMSFRYDEKNVIKTMEVETGSELEKLVVTFLYDEKGRVNQTSTSVAGIPFLKNVLRPLQKVDIMIFNFCTMNLVLIFLPFWPLFNLLIVNKPLLKLFSLNYYNWT